MEKCNAICWKWEAMKTTEKKYYEKKNNCWSNNVGDKDEIECTENWYKIIECSFIKKSL